MVVELVVALKDVLLVLLRDTLTRISHHHLDLILVSIQRYVDPTSTRRKLQGVREQIRYNLLEFVAICPSHQLFTHSLTVDGNTLLLGIKLEGVADVVHLLRHVSLFHTQTKGVVLQLVEVHQLVDELEHTLYAALGDAKQTTFLIVERSALGQLFHRTGNHRQGRTELMGDVGKETHVHLVGAQFLFLFHLSLSSCSSGLHHALGVLVEIASQHDAQYQIDEPSPPREHRRRFYHHLDGSFVAVAFVAGVVGSPHSEGIVTSRQIGIAG